MNNSFSPKSWQIKWISIGLFFIIPMTIQLGIEFLYPSVSWEKINEEKINYFENEIKDYNQENYHKNPRKYMLLWESSDVYQQLEQEKLTQQKFYILVINFFVLLLSLIALIIQTPYILMAFIGSIIVVAISNINFWYLFYKTNFDTMLFFNIPITLLSILTLLVSLIIIIYLAHRDRKL